jgi:flagellar hook-associated protein 2
MAAITSTGLGSGLKINDIVTAIVGAEKDPAMKKIDADAKTATDKISAFSALNSALSSFKSSYKELGYSSTYSAVSIKSSDEGILTAKGGIGAETGSFEFKVNQRAQAHTLVSGDAATFSNPNATVGTGTLTLRFGTYNGDGSFSVNADKTIKTITVDSSNNSLSGLRDTINKGDFGVTASIINDGSAYRLVLTSKETGEANAIELTAADDDGNNTDAGGLSRFAYDATNKNMKQTSVAQNASIEMNGITITRSKNEIDSVIQGVTLNLNGVTEPGKVVKLTIGKDTSTIESQIRAFMDTYNKTASQINDLTKYNGSGSTNGVLIGDATVRNVKSLMRDVLNTQTKDTGSSIRSFADLGLLTKKDGTLELDETKFKAAMSGSVEDISKFFTQAGKASDPQVNYVTNNSLTKPGTYSVEVTQLATQSQLTASTALTFPLTVDADNDAFKVRIDGILSGEIKLAQKPYATAQDFAAEMQSKINSDSTLSAKAASVKVSVDADGKLQLTSDRYGSRSMVAFTEVDTNFAATFGIGVQQGSDAVDAKGKIDGIDALGDGNTLLSESGNSTGIKVEITGGALGSRGSVTLSEGLTSVMNTVLDGIIDKSISSSKGDMDVSDSLLDGKIDSLYKQLVEGDRRETDLKYRMDKLEARLYKQFNAMDSVVSQLSATMSSLTQSLATLPGYTNSSS